MIKRAKNGQRFLFLSVLISYSLVNRGVGVNLFFIFKRKEKNYFNSADEFCKFEKNSTMYSIAVIGATGLVGRKILQVMEEQEFPVSELLLVASERSKGKQVLFCGQYHSVMTIEAVLQRRPQIAIFSAGGMVSKENAQRFAEIGCYVIDNSSAWRREAVVPLVVPEVNASTITRENFIIANPNCSTIQLVMILAPLHRQFGVKRIVVSTYQSVTGSGLAGKNQLMDEREGKDGEKAYPHPIDMNIIPQGGAFLPSGYTTEEEKLIFETQKILNDEAIAVAPTVVRVPVTGGHSEAVNVQFRESVNAAQVRAILMKQPGIIVMDDPGNEEYPMPVIAEDKDEVFVGRLRDDTSQPNTLDMWIVSDNLRKGAATNAVQIARYIIENNFLRKND
jgi:aspartate-semialdehyde dehydrogenase